MNNKYVNIFIVFFFSGTIVSLTFRLIDNILFSNSEFSLQTWTYSNLAIFSIALVIVYLWIKKSKA
tara:strand:- start:219 stop:416 length:198 start_codon:yes stop_codon:yes gene_type:complete